MNPFLIWESPVFRISQSHDFQLPGYLFVENLTGAPSLTALPPWGKEHLGEILAFAESLVRKLLAPETIYILKFGESDERIHFHIIPRTRRLLDAYLQSEKDEPPYNGARITSWLWSNSSRLGHKEEEIYAFVQAARNESAV